MISAMMDDLPQILDPNWVQDTQSLMSRVGDWESGLGSGNVSHVA